METWRADLFAAAGVDLPFVQDNQSSSRQGVLRGLHYQIQQPQGKLVRVISGRVFDVAVDLRRSSPTFGRWVGAELSAENHRLIWVPPGFAHGFYVLSEQAEFVYKCTDYYAPRARTGHPLRRPGHRHRLAAACRRGDRPVGQGRGGRVPGRGRTLRLRPRAARPEVAMFAIGQGWDRHRLAAGTPLCPGRGGVPGLPGGAGGPFRRRRGLPRRDRRPAGGGRPGGHRPPFSRHRPRWAGADSLDLLREAVAPGAGRGVYGGQRRLHGHHRAARRSRPAADAMRDAAGRGLADRLPDRVSVKATRGEGLGPEGRGECVTVQAVALLEGEDAGREE